MAMGESELLTRVWAGDNAKVPSALERDAQERLDLDCGVSKLNFYIGFDSHRLTWCHHITAFSWRFGNPVYGRQVGDAQHGVVAWLCADAGNHLVGRAGGKVRKVVSSELGTVSQYEVTSAGNNKLARLFR